MDYVPKVLEPVDDVGEFVCLDRLANGSLCGRTFSTQRQLTTHRMASVKLGGDHGVLSLGGLVVTNQCPFCRTPVASRNAAQTHVRNAFAIGYCNIDKGILNVPVVIPTLPIICKLCDRPFENLNDYNSHLAQELGACPAQPAGSSTLDDVHRGLSGRDRQGEDQRSRLRSGSLIVAKAIIEARSARKSSQINRSPRLSREYKPLKPRSSSTRRLALTKQRVGPQCGQQPVRQEGQPEQRKRSSRRQRPRGLGHAHVHQCW